MRHLGAGLGDAPGNRQIERGQQIVPGSVADELIAKAQALGALQHKGKARLVAAVQRIAGIGAAADVKIADRCAKLTVTRRKPHRDIDDFPIGVEGQCHAATLSVSGLRSDPNLRLLFHFANRWPAHFCRIVQKAESIALTLLQGSAQ